jgi:hypothetical protein
VNGGLTNRALASLNIVNCNDASSFLVQATPDVDNDFAPIESDKGSSLVLFLSCMLILPLTSNLGECVIAPDSQTLGAGECGSNAPGNRWSLPGHQDG